MTLDTATEWVSICLSRHGEVVAELTWWSDYAQSLNLIPEVLHLMKLAGAEMDSLTGIIVVRGPGSFNGLRAGVAAAKGLAFALSIPLVGVSTLEAIAFPFAFTGLPLCPLLPLGRELAAALYQEVAGEWRRLREEELTSLEKLTTEIREETLFCGAISPELEGELRSRLGGKARVAPLWSGVRRAGFAAALGWKRLSRGETEAPATFQPLYLRRPHISERKHP